MGTIAIDTALGRITVQIEAELARTLVGAVRRLQAGALLAGGVGCVGAFTCCLGALMEEQT